MLNDSSPNVKFGEVMNITKPIMVMIVILLLWQGTPSQANSQPKVLSEKVMNAEFKSIDDTTSVSFKLTDYRGKIIVLALWASWCGPCRFTATSLNDLNKEYGSRGVEVLGLSSEDPKEDAQVVRATVKELQLEYTIGWINREVGKELVGDRNSIPQIFVITDEGLIVKRFIGWSPTQTPSLLREAVELALVNPPKKQ
jgi:thiol-disulfide isomerase/thioredoxin